MFYVRALYFAVAFAVVLVRSEVTPRSFSVEVTASVEPEKGDFTLSWPADPDATGYTVRWKSIYATAWGTRISLPGQATHFNEDHMVAGAAYEYQIIKSKKQGFNAYGYIYAGSNLPLVEDRGTILLVVDNTYAADLKFELVRLEQDLIGDGWAVRRQDVSRTDSVTSVKARIKAEYDTDPANVRSVFLFGHVPVPYSGDIVPDGHPNHQGAWPADVYYGDIKGVWTDSSVTSTQAERRVNWNLPGDGKFDQSEPPSDVELEVGRVDLSNLTCFSNQNPTRSELDLLRQYLNKDHAFRHRLINVQRRGLICNTLGISQEVDHFSGSGWRNFVPFFGSENIRVIGNWQYLPTLYRSSYLWSQCSSGGSYYRSDSIVSSEDFALEDLQVVFTMFVGSYFGDWNNESNLLRAALGSRSYVLTASFSGAPQTYYHPMALGETIGYGIRLTQNNGSRGLYPPHNPGSGQVHISLLGDPALRLHPVIPPFALTGTTTTTGVVLNWSPSSDVDLQGYHVYRAASPSGPFTRISGTKPLLDATFTDSTAPESATYMVRAIKLERSGSGTYFNASQGIFVSIAPSAGTAALQSVPTPPSSLMAIVEGAGQIRLLWVDTAGEEDGFQVERKTGENGSYALSGLVPANSTGYIDREVAPGTRYFYRVRAYNAAGASVPSNEASTTSMETLLSSSPASVTFAGVDASTRGNWQGHYGREGYYVIGYAANYPDYAGVASTFSSLHFWALSTREERALQTGTNDARVAACWFGTDAFSVDLSLRDGRLHRVGLYFLDWEGAGTGRAQKVEIVDRASGLIRDTQFVSEFQQGKYLSWDLSGSVNIRITHVTQNAVLSGIFFDTERIALLGRTSEGNGAEGTSIISPQPAVPGGNFWSISNRKPAESAALSEGALTKEGFRLRVIGDARLPFILEASTDLVTWTPILTNGLLGTSNRFSDPNTDQFECRFYRTRFGGLNNR